MHYFGLVFVVITGIYTVAWAVSLVRRKNYRGAVVALLLAVFSTAVGLYHFLRLGG